MIPTTTIEKILQQARSYGAGFAEVFVEDSRNSSVTLLDRKIDEVNAANNFGIGIRLIYGSEVRYGYSSDPEEAVLLKLVGNLSKPGSHQLPDKISPLLRRQIESIHHVAIDPETVANSERAELLYRIDQQCRKHGNAISQVSAVLAEKKRTVLIANSEGLLVQDERSYARAGVTVVADKADGPQRAFDGPGVLGGFEFFRGLDVESLSARVAESALRMADAGYIDGGTMPVILGNGFGGVIFHEACGHPLETESVRKNASPFCGQIGAMVAQPILTAIDDGTMAGYWGSLMIDDEGMPSQRTLLIEKGVLKGFLSDQLGARQVGIARTGSARRESYKFAPVSRMRNTYIDRGNDSFEDMIASIDFGLYAKKMSGGSVDPGTGEFNFAVSEGYVIRKGKIAEPVRGATLTGKGFEILPRISMIGSDLELAPGMCGAASGMVPTTVGQPTLKVDAILVGGR